MSNGDRNERVRAARALESKRQKKKRRKAAARVALRLITILLVLSAAALTTVWALDRVKTPQSAEPGQETGAPAEQETPATEPEVILPEPEPTTEDGIPMTQLKENVYMYERDGVTWLRIEGYDMILCNKDYALPQDFGGEISGEAREAFDAMFAAAQADGHFLDIGSGYRSYDTQESIHNRYLSTYGEEYTKAMSAEPGHSEHQTGLAADLYGENGHYLEQAFETTPEFEWLDAHAAEYGFILRFQKGKTWATGYIYEPWHYRYVGVELAKILKASGLTVEEYAGIPWKSSPEDYEGYE